MAPWAKDKFILIKTAFSQEDGFIYKIARVKLAGWWLSGGIMSTEMRKD